MDPCWQATTRSADPTLAAIAAKAEKEVAYHLRHSAEWLIRLGDGTEESRRRAEAALDPLWPYHRRAVRGRRSRAALIAAGIAPDPATLRDQPGTRR